MALTIEIPFQKKIVSPKKAVEVALFFKDPNQSIANHFPGLEKLSNIQGNDYQWQFQNLKYAGYQLKLTLDTTLVWSPQSLEIIPLPSSEHRLSALWEFESTATGTVICMRMKIVLQLPVPSLMKSIIQPFAQTELTKLLEQFADNVGKALA